jgi:glycosyltransferase involved in cell wall biosynthesis
MDSIRARGLHDNVEFLGHLNHDALAGSLKAAWVQAVPSTWPEPFGMVAIEAMMQGVPVVASAHGGLPEIVDHGVTGFLVPPGDSNQLAQALLRILRHRETAESMGAASYARAFDKFSIEACCDRFVSYYENLIQRRRHY